MMTRPTLYPAPPAAVPRGKTQWALLLALLAVVLLGAFAGLTLTALNHSYHDAMKLAEIDELGQRVKLLDDALTATATLAAVYGDHAWHATYERDERELREAWPTLRRELNAMDLGVSMTTAERADLELSRLERQALALAGAGQRAEALALLRGPHYRQTKATFAKFMREVDSQIDARLIRGRADSKRNQVLLISAFLLLVPIFSVCWITAFRALREYIRRRDQTEGWLRESEERFALAARATKDVMYDWNVAARTLRFTEAVKTELGHGDWENVDLDAWASNFHPDDAPRLFADIRALLAGDGRSWTAEYRFRRGDGTYAHIFDRGYVVRNAEGQPMRLIGAMQDLSRRVQNEAALRAVNAELERVSRKSELILNAAADGIVGVDRDCRASFMNHAAATILGLDMDDLRGQMFHDLTHHTKADGTPRTYDECENLRAITTGETTFVHDDVFWRKDGTSFAVEYSATPMRDEDGAILGAVVTFRDVTEKRAVQRMKDEFVSTVSHELRTPLTSIRGALGLLAGGLLTKSPEKGQRMLDIAVSNADRLVRLINDILDIERIDSGKVVLTKTRCTPYELLMSSFDVMRPLAEKAGVTLAAGPVDSATFWADSDRIIQTLTNLLSNAIKFSPAGSAVTVSAACGREGIDFRVADQGRGIPADKLESVFDRFQQVDASDSREKGGSGLGLTICRSIVRQHGGEMSVESTLGKGSTFRFTLPATHIEASPCLTGGPRVVICDDDAVTRTLLESILRQHGYDVRAVRGGEELLSCVPSFAPDAILLDIFMPEMNGWETLARLKRNPATAAIPVVIVSALTRGDADARDDFAGWVSKPLDAQALFATLEHALGVSGSGPRIMVVEDDFDLARVVIESFERRGIETMHAATGREAIELMSLHRPDLLILDLVLPELDGFAVVDRLRDSEELRNVPLVVYSAADPSAADRERLTLGATHFLTKSRVPPQEFERRVVALLDSMTASKGAIADVA
jgi:PAS domain S-box-containing protein